MSDIFLSYANEDLPRVLPLVRALEQHGWAVWWDRTIPPGKTFDEVIESALATARCVVVVWSRAAVASRWVRTEADEGLQKNILIPVLIDEAVAVPLAFRLVQAARLQDWHGTEPHPELEKLLRAVTGLIGPPQPTEAPFASAALPRPPSVTPQQTSASRVPPETAPPASPRGMRRRQSLWLIGGGVGVLVTGAYVASTRKPPSRSSTPSETGSAQSPTPAPSTAFADSLGMEFVRIPAGEFQMGSTTGDDNERPIHTVRVSQPFFMGKYEVTQGQWQAVMGNNPSRFKGDTLPVENVSWEDVQEFLRRLQGKEGGTQYRLPTEAEWEYAARAGSTTVYSFGDDTAELRRYAWYSATAGSKAHPVGQLRSNAWGLYDMHGNVWEWVQDWYGPYTAAPAVDPVGPASGSDRVIRGGSWYVDAGSCRSAYRSAHVPGTGSRRDYLGFRLARTAW